MHVCLNDVASVQSRDCIERIAMHHVVLSSSCGCFGIQWHRFGFLNFRIFQMQRSGCFDIGTFCHTNHSLLAIIYSLAVHSHTQQTIAWLQWIGLFHIVMAFKHKQHRSRFVIYGKAGSYGDHNNADFHVA